ncbi:DNA (cytosine-5-)-methyltransferase [Prolixibacter sp. NT017]|uniref:DNA (cytosine-5-)-methyltransferase n=1 Tax=Prolixibacter sp. NT017 TaxID=2652390 RepID=UPI001285D071|nr:DNA (cytosine-5-)-methyltransferase [Prolixibacter sp. NT017]GET25069.1 cytosine-specific methyltransferase [Prolixibacter sp. NT017]
MIKYSEIRKRLEFEQKKELDDQLAGFTHYLHSPQEYSRDDYYKPLEEQLNGSKLNKVEETALKLPLKWDVPFPPPEDPKFTFIDLFAGIGGIRLAYQLEGGKCVFSSEYNKFAKVTYEANFGEIPFGDITKIDEKFIPNHDILLGGFPCQPFSIAGVSKKNSLGRNHGFLDETQGTLFFDIARILKEKRPKAFMLENVKNLRSHDKGNTYRVIHNTLKELGYNLHVDVLDGKHFVPQHRERIIIVGFDKEIFNGEEKFDFPELPKANRTIEEILEPEVAPKYTLTDNLWKYLQEYAAKHKAKGNGFGYGLVDFDGISRTMSARYYKDGAEILIPQGPGLTPRRLTPRESARLQGFPDEFVIPVSDTQAYRQFGNSVVMPLMNAVAKKIIRAIS